MYNNVFQVVEFPEDVKLEEYWCYVHGATKNYHCDRVIINISISHIFCAEMQLSVPLDCASETGSIPYIPKHIENNMLPREELRSDKRFVHPSYESRRGS